ncbi:MAG: hypothetical protein NWE89_01210 [Candidatus Bathyarchaeota archaeon]|nr:hypothetical protein [Candidatus Bathyarchaeota archaeon]
MRRVTVDEITRGELPKGSFIMVRWLDASDIKAKLTEHVESPEVNCKDWGLYLGVSGRKRRMLLLGKDVVEMYNEWGATRIPLELVEEVVLVLPREEMMQVIQEVGVLGRRVNLRKYSRKEERMSVRVG